MYILRKLKSTENVFIYGYRTVKWKNFVKNNNYCNGNCAEVYYSIGIRQKIMLFHFDCVMCNIQDQHHNIFCIS